MDVRRSGFCIIAGSCSPEPSAAGTADARGGLLGAEGDVHVDAFSFHDNDGHP